jgi:lipoyl(octanoyl) transferase
MRRALPGIRTCATVPSDDLRLVSTAWRLLIDAVPGDGAWNMAVDRAVQIAHSRGEAPPTLRLYEWARPTVSLGRFQDCGSVDAAFCANAGIELVRRYTGGRGVLHDDEVTYSVVAGAGDGIPRGTGASYGLLCGGLAQAYRLLGVEAALTPRSRGSRDSAACYLHATQADLSLGLRKLSGSAQVWLGSTVLQHGSFTISRNVARDASAFRLDAEERERLDEETVTLESALGCKPSRRLVRDCVAAGFSQAMGVELVPGVLSDAETGIAAQLQETRAADTPHDSATPGSR